MTMLKDTNSGLLPIFLVGFACGGLVFTNVKGMIYYLPVEGTQRVLSRLLPLDALAPFDYNAEHTSTGTKTSSSQITAATNNNCVPNLELQDAVDAFQQRQQHEQEDFTSHGIAALRPQDPIGSWCVSTVEDFSYVFWDHADFNEDVSDWDVSLAVSMQGVFQGAAAFDQEIGSWNTGRVTTMKSMFQDALAFDGDLSQWDVSKVTDMESMFWYATSFDGGDIGSWNTGEVTNMYGMFAQALQFNADLSAWDVSQVTTTSEMFRDATAFNQNLCAWGSKLNPSMVNVTDMFRNSACPRQEDPDFTLDPPSPFCHVCTASTNSHDE